MELIDKEKVVVEIERIKKEECPTDTYEGRCKLFWFEQFSSFLDNLEVKEVDFEKEWKEYFKYRGDMATVNIIHLAKHFFELGLNARKGK